jgi:Holliday junction resolvase-like predicted endonuclease
LTKSERWILSEWRVARDRTTRFHEQLVAHRERTPFAEIDLLFKKRDLYVLVEVKSWRGELWAPEVISVRQAQRLVRARLFLEARLESPVQLWLAVVDPCDAGESGIRYFENWTGGF